MHLNSVSMLPPLDHVLVEELSEQLSSFNKYAKMIILAIWNTSNLFSSFMLSDICCVLQWVINETSHWVAYLKNVN